MVPSVEGTVSRLYRWLLEGFTPQTVADILRPDTEGPDRVLSSPAMEIEQVFGRGFEVAPPARAPAGARIREPADGS